MISRRAALFGLTGLGGLAALLGWRVRAEKEQDAVIAVLRKRLDYLTLDEDGIRHFADDLVARHSVSDFKLRLLATAGPIYASLASIGHGAIRDGIRHGEERVVTLYLLSSDFFVNKKDETRPVRYLGFYDPMRACSSPFARPMIGYIDQS